MKAIGTIMTTYPLSEPATIYLADEADAAAQGTLAECAELIEGFSSQQRTSARVEMDALDLRFDAKEIDELLRFLREECGGLSNQEISAIAKQDD
ncbi:hypothetical protein [Sphingomonas sp. LT1P40]|uniref:hypothetical protein n=1 Tax=Alteristakelama amylovorans TaxID=3096166 RepID=UPI002FC7DCEE